MTFRNVLIALAAFVSIPASPAEYVTTTTLSTVSTHGTRPADPSANNRDLVIVASNSSWDLHSGGGAMTCRTDGVALPDNNSMLRAEVLLAIATGSTVEIIIDTTLPTVAGFCQVAVLSILR